MAVVNDAGRAVVHGVSAEAQKSIPACLAIGGAVLPADRSLVLLYIYVNDHK